MYGNLELLINKFFYNNFYFIQRERLMVTGLHGVHGRSVQRVAQKMVVRLSNVIVNATCLHQCLEVKNVKEVTQKRLLDV